MNFLHRNQFLKYGQKENDWLVLIHVFYFLIFCAVSLINHYYFRSAGLDYGVANQALYQYAHFKNAVCSQLIGGIPSPYLALHMSLWVPILSPFYWIFGSYTLLIFQNLALVFCGIGIAKFAKLNGFNQLLISLILVQFYSSFALFSALAFDYHDNVIGACFFLGFFIIIKEIIKCWRF